MTDERAMPLKDVLAKGVDKLSDTYITDRDLSHIVADRGGGKAKLDGEFTLEELRAIIAFIEPKQEG